MYQTIQITACQMKLRRNVQIYWSNILLGLGNINTINTIVSPVID